ncbi:MAG: response regulator transcription factor [Methylococcaceae bacterium]|nr:response regulator transcription factor [Methylococcaceae bacterium]
MTRVLIADDHTMFRQGLRRLLLDAADLEVGGEAASGSETLEFTRSGGIDVVLLDISFPDLSGLEILRKLKESGFPGRVLMLSMHPAETYAMVSASLGANGYVDKDCSSHELIDAIRTIAAGGSYLPPRIAGDIVFDSGRHRFLPRHHKLSPKEYQVFLRLAKGECVSGIADAMGIKSRTVSTYRARLLVKLQLNNNAQLVRYAVEQGIV